jgi:hypothetical protein
LFKGYVLESGRSGNLREKKDNSTHLATLQLNEILNPKMNGYQTKKIDQEVRLPVDQRKSSVSVPLADITSPKPAILSEDGFIVVEVVPLVISFSD